MAIDFTARRGRIGPALGLTDEILLVGAGHPLARPELSDQLLPFIAHQEYYYLTGQASAPGAVVAFDPRHRASATGVRFGGDPGWVSFVPEVTENDRVWEGRQQLPGQLLDQLPAWLAERSGRRVLQLGAPVPEIPTDETRSAEVRETFKHLRRVKEQGEIELMRRCALSTVAGYAAIQSFLRPGLTERRIQVELEAEYFRRGADRTGYDTIIGGGPNSAVFHGSPSERAVQEGEFILIDSGAERDRYVIDVTRTYVAGRPTPFQRELFQTVLYAETRAIARCRPGAEWKDIHFAAALDLVTGLVAMGVMKGDPQSLIDRDAHLLFFPHGIGHMLGLGVRDASGLEPGRPRDPRPSLRTLRMDLILRPGYIVTVEPGLYFIPALLNDPVRRATYRDCVNWPLVDTCLHLGGVRLEDNILVTTGEPENLTAAIPKLL